MKYEAIIFDFDGTLADTSPGILNCVRYTQKTMGLPEISESNMYSHIGPPMEESYNRNFGLKGDELAKAVSLHKQYAVNKGYKELKLYDGIRELLDKLKDNGIYTAIATLKAQDTVLKILNYFHMMDRFDNVFGVDIAAPKNKAQLLQDCLERSGKNADGTVLVGDSRYDAEGAAKAGIDFIGVTYGFGFRTKEEVYKYTTVGAVDSVKELEKYILKHK